MDKPPSRAASDMLHGRLVFDLHGDETGQKAEKKKD